MSIWGDTKDVFSGRRSIGNVIKSKLIGYRTIRVALMGSRESGKTVFLTSLENHLREHVLHPQDFSLGGRIVDWDKNAIKNKDEIHGIPRCNYENARGMLQKGEWPEKTTSSSILAMRLRITDKDGKQEDVQLEIVDIPGERMADFTMRGRPYKAWCRWMERESASADYQTYLQKVKDAGPDARGELFSAYRDFIANEYESYAPCITPSTVKLSLDGKKRGGNPETFKRAVADTPIGFTDKKGKVWEFLPLPEECLDKKPWKKLVQEFEKSYDQYVKRVVRPVADWMENAEKLVYLVDMLSLLQAGGKACTAERQYGEAAIEVLCPRSPDGILSRMGVWAKSFLWKTHIHAVYLVATKGDCVWSNQNRDHLATLADDLFRSTTRFLDKRITYVPIPCAAVCSTKERTGGQSGLEGKILDPQKPDEPPTLQRWKPSDVPVRLPESSEEWDARIAAGEFNYPIAFPWFDPVQLCPPKQINLNLLAEAILARN